MTIQYETRGTAGLCLLHTLFPGCTSLMLLFAWNITLVRALQPHSPDLCARWKLLPTMQAGEGTRDRERLWPRPGAMGVRVPATDWKGEQRFSRRKMGESARGNGGMPHQTSLGWRRSNAPAALWPTREWPQERVHFWLQKKPSRAAAVIAASLHWSSSWGPTPRWVKGPKEWCQRAPVLTSWHPASLRDSPRGVPDSPRQPGGMPADLGVTTCKPGWSYGPYLHFNLPGGWRHFASECLQDLRTWAVTRQTTGLLRILLCYTWLEGAMKWDSGIPAGCRQTSVVNNTHGDAINFYNLLLMSQLGISL